MSYKSQLGAHNSLGPGGGGESRGVIFVGIALKLETVGRIFSISFSVQELNFLTNCNLCSRVRALGQVAGKLISVLLGLVTLATTML